MTERSLHTVQLQLWAQRIQAGDSSAPDELLRATSHRLERLTHRMLRRFPTVGRWEQAGDVLVNAQLRLLRSLQEVKPPSVAAFFRLAAEHIRRELIDLARHYTGPHGLGAHHESQGPGGPPEPADQADSPDDLEWWCAFHEGVAGLPDAEREVVDHLFYHGRTQVEAAELLQIDERTVRRRWKAAMVKLHGLIGEGPSF